MAVRSFRPDSRPKAYHKPVKLEYDYGRLRNLAKSAWDKGEALAASGDLAGAVAWLGRAHRSAPADQNILFKLAWLHLQAGDAGGAASLFGALALRHKTRECLSGLIAALLALGRLDEAIQATRTALSETATEASLAGLAARVVAGGGMAGWCGLADDGALLTDAPRIRLTALNDGRPVRLRALSAGRFRLLAPLEGTGKLEVFAAGQPLLGSPIDPGRMFRLEGFAERTPQGIGGWAWHPGAPGRNPILSAMDETGVPLGQLTASEPLQVVDLQTPLARPRAFSWICRHDRIIRMTGPDGRDLPGSPVTPENLAPPPARARRPRPAPPDVPADVVIPVYRGLAATLACIGSVVETLPGDSRIWVVNDASPEPELVEALSELAKCGKIRLISTGDSTINRGFPAAVNAGLQAAKGRHVVLLNSDTLVAPGWLDRLRAAACSSPDIGTATPLSNNASIFSYPGEAGKNPAPDLSGTRRLAQLAAKANGGRLVEVPTAHGFCMFIRRDCLEQTGLFEDRLFAQGYGEENDFCERARALGWRHVGVPEVYVAHLGGVSFGTAREHLLRRNLRLLENRHPGYLARVNQWIEADPLRPARHRLDVARWRDEASGALPQGDIASGALPQGDIASGALPPNPRQECATPGPAFSGTRPSYVLVTHGAGGGTARVVNQRVSALREAGYRPVVLRAVDGLCEVDDGEGNFPNLRFALPAEFAALRRLLAEGQPEAAEVHHLLGHDHSILRLFAELCIPYEIWVHDYAWFCARLSFITGDGFFCGEAEPEVCASCVAKWGSELEETIAAADLRRRSAADLKGARAVVVPAADVARRVSRHVPGLKPVIRPWEAEPAPVPYRAPPPRGRRKVAVIGAIGIDKGYDVLLACAQDAAIRKLDLEFVVVGFTVNDEALLETNRVFITGMFASGEAVPLIRAQAADLAFLPSIWPETWCYALSDAWAGGLPAAVFDIGTPPARVRAARRGWVLPLGLPAPRVNDALLSLAMLNIHPPLSLAV